MCRPESGKRRLSPSPENEPLNPPKRSSSGFGPLPDQANPVDLHTLTRPGRAVAAQEAAGQDFILQAEPLQDSSTARKVASRKSPQEGPKNQSARAETPPTDRGKSLRTGKAEKPRTGRVEMWQSEKVNMAIRAGQRQGQDMPGAPGPSAPPAQEYPYTTPLPIYERFICEWPWEMVSCVRDYLADREFKELQQWDPCQPQQPGSGAAGRALRYLNNIRGSREQQAWVPPDLKQLVQLPPLDDRLNRILAAQDLKLARLDARPQPPQPLTDLYDLVNRMHRLHLHMRDKSLVVSEMHGPPRLSLAALHFENGDRDDAALSRQIEPLPRQREPSSSFRAAAAMNRPRLPTRTTSSLQGCQVGACAPQTPCTAPLVRAQH